VQRQYYQRGRLVEVEELDDLLAVQVDPDQPSAETPDVTEFGESAFGSLIEDDVEFDESAAAAYRRSGWLIVRPGAGDESAGGAAAPPAAAHTGKVIRRPGNRIGIATDRLNVQLQPDMAEDDARRRLSDNGLEVLNRLNFAPNLYEVRTTAAEDALATSVILHDNPDFVFAEPSFVEHIPSRLTPADSDFHRQWQWKNTGQDHGTPGADVHIEEAWALTRGAGVKVAVIDNGFDCDHEDLAAGVISSSGFFRSRGSATAFVAGTSGMPDSDHGTFCAGMVGARAGNRGGVGAAAECQLMLLACLGDQVGTQTTLARAVAYAADPRTEVPTADPADGADILVSSLGPNGADWDLTSTLELALRTAAANGRGGRGLAIFWAASNGHNVDVLKDEVVSHPDVIAVVRSDRNDREDNAARGSEVELIAPGVDVFSTESGNRYGTSTGTSFAAPCAAGCAALALAVAPELSRDELRILLRETADRIGGVVYDETGHNDDYGFGRVNASVLVSRAALTRQSAPASA
jgi:subtilisin family serine protease